MGTQAAAIDHIRNVIEETPHVGPESEGIVTDLRSLEVVHNIGDMQPTQAVKAWVEKNIKGEEGKAISRVITPDISETTIESNPDVLRSAASTAAAQRLLAIIIHLGLTDLSHGELQLVHGAALRPPRVSAQDVSTSASFWKSEYYKHQIRHHGDASVAAAGDHFNLSAPWLKTPATSRHETSRRMFEMTARMRLIGVALSIALSASSPLYMYANGGRREATFGTAITQWESARLGSIWPNRTIMDVAGLFSDPKSFIKIMTWYAANGVLKSGRDIWLQARAQPGEIAERQTLEELFEEHGIDKERAKELLAASFAYGPNNREINPFQNDKDWQIIESWRQQMLKDVIQAPRNRVELRMMETPPAFDDVTPYEYIKSVQTFIELLFIYLSQDPEFVQNLEYDAISLQAAKNNEKAVLLGGLDASVYWLPNMRTATPRGIIEMLLGKMKDLSAGLGRDEDLEIIRRVIDGGLKTPAARIREEVADWYDINLSNRHNPRLLPDDSYTQHLLRRTRQAMPKELEQIRAALKSLPEKDRPEIEKLLAVAEKLQNKLNH